MAAVRTLLHARGSAMWRHCLRATFCHAALLSSILRPFAAAQPSPVWSSVYGGWPATDRRQQGSSFLCASGTYAKSFSLVRLRNGNGWVGGETWVGTLSMTCTNGITFTLDAQPNSPLGRGDVISTPATAAGFSRVSISSGWAVDNVFDLPGGHAANSNFTCPSGQVIVGFKGAAVSYPRGWVVDLQLACLPRVGPSPSPRIVTGPFGSFNPSNAFDDAAGQALPLAPITKIVVASGSWIDSITMTYGNAAALPKRGGAGGGVGAGNVLTLAPGEYITDATVISGAFVDALFFTTNRGRSIGLGSTGSGATGSWATVCPSGSYRLVALRGSASQYLESISFVWEYVPGTPGPDGAAAAARAAGWTCPPGLGSLVRSSGGSSPQPQCLALNGSRTCLNRYNCWQLLSCVGARNTATLSPCAAGVTPPRARQGVAPSGAYQDPTNFCPRAQGCVNNGVLSKTPVPIQTVFIMLSICNSSAAGSLSDLNRTLFTDPYSLKTYWRAISRGQAYFNESTALVRTVRLPCADFSTPTSCAFDSWVGYVDAHAAALGVPQLPAFTYHRVFLNKPDTSAADCGAGFSSGSNVYINGYLLSSTSDYLNVFKHELGHSLGLSHSSVWDSSQPDGSRNQEYGDGSTPMGYCQRCSYAAPHLIQLGWAKPLSTLVGADLVPGVWSPAFDIPALVDSALSVLVVHVDWERNGNGATGGTNRPLGAAPDVFLSYRLAKGQDAGLPTNFVGGVSVHSISDGGGNTYLEAVVNVQGTWVDSSFGIAVRMVQPRQQGQATVKVCRLGQGSQVGCA